MSKIEYEKPIAAVEFYKLSQSIASFDIKINYLDNMCVVMDDDSPDEMRSYALDYPNYFSTMCDTVCTNNPEYETLCYHTQVNASFVS